MPARMYAPPRALPAPARMLRAPSVAAFVAGAAASTRWGPVQVAVVLTGGTITQVQVAGATYTSEGYRRSLQSALDQR